MIVPGHVVFLWRIIHQHFTLAFLEHISACHRNKPSWPFWKKLPTLAKNLQFTLNCPVFFWRDLSDAPPTRVPLFWFIWAAANPGGFLSPNSLFIQRDARTWKGRAFPFFSFSFNDARYFASGFLCVVGAFLRRLDHLDLRPSLLPYPPLLPLLPLPEVAMAEGGRGHTSHLWPKQAMIRAFMRNNVTYIYILNAAKTRKRISGSWVQHFLRWSVRKSDFTNT